MSNQQSDNPSSILQFPRKPKPEEHSEIYWSTRYLLERHMQVMNLVEKELKMTAGEKRWLAVILTLEIDTGGAS